jgi:hypothetical protein
MRTRTIALVVALALAPAGASADRHPLDCFYGWYLFTSDGLKAQSISCGVYTDVVFEADLATTTPQPSPTPPPPPPPGGSPSQTTDSQPPEEHTTFLVIPEIVRFTDVRDGRDFTRYVVTGGVRHYFGTGRIQPYAQVGAGFAQTNHIGPTDFGWAFAGAAGLDAKLAELGRHDLVFRASCGVARTFGVGSPDTVGHCAPSIGIRFDERP